MRHGQPPGTVDAGRHTGPVVLIGSSGVPVRAVIPSVRPDSDEDLAVNDEDLACSQSLLGTGTQRLTCEMHNEEYHHAWLAVDRYSSIITC